MDITKSKQYLKLNIDDRAYLKLYADTPSKLFKYINHSIDQQTTLKSKFVKRSVFRGLLRTYYQYTDPMMQAIEASHADKQAYHDSGVAGLASQTESKLSTELLADILDNYILYCLCMSGLRVDELLSNDYLMSKTAIEFRLNKKRTNNYYRITIIGSFTKWRRLFLNIRKNMLTYTAVDITNILNLDLKKIIPDSFYKRSTHICRGIYTLLIKSLEAPAMTMPNLIKKYLHHESANPSVHYQNLVWLKKPSKLNLKKLISKAQND
jgi:hypothetical protein